MSKCRTIITVNAKEMSPEEFKQFKEDLEKDRSKKLKEVSPGNYTILNRMQE